MLYYHDQTEKEAVYNDVNNTITISDGMYLFS